MRGKLFFLHFQEKGNSGSSLSHLKRHMCGQTSKDPFGSCSEQIFPILTLTWSNVELFWSPVAQEPEVGRSSKPFGERGGEKTKITLIYRIFKGQTLSKLTLPFTNTKIFGWKSQTNTDFSCFANFPHRFSFKGASVDMFGKIVRGQILFNMCNTSREL